MKKNYVIVVELVLSFVIMLVSCKQRSSYDNPLFDIDSIEQFKKDSITRFLQETRDSATIVMKNDRTVFGEIKLGISKQNYNKIINSLRTQLKGDGLIFNDINLRVSDAKFYKEKLYSLTLYSTYIYRGYHDDFNGVTRYDPSNYIKPIIEHFKKKYGLPDSEQSNFADIRGREKANWTKVRWTFPIKEIIINNEAETYGGGPQGASYILSITIHEHSITSMLQEKERKEKELQEQRLQKEKEKKQDKMNELINSL